MTVMYSWAFPRPSSSGGAFGGGGGSTFPLSISGNGRYFVGANGVPFYMQIDAGWSAIVNLTQTQMAAYIDDCAAKGFTGILVNAIEHNFSNQTPAYRNVNGDDPFTTMGTPPTFQSLNNAYWNQLDYFVNYAKTKSMAVLINPCYFGFGGGAEGWYTEMNAATDANLQAYGQALGNRYTQSNVLWPWGGDFDGDATSRAKQRQIQAGIRSVRTTDLVTFHTAPNENTSDVVVVADYPNLFDWVYAYEHNSVYPFARVGTAYGVSPTRPVYFGEGAYENENSSTAAQLRRASYSSLCAGALGGVSFGNNPIWKFTTGYASSFNSTGRVEQSYFIALVNAVQWWKLQPKTDTSLVTSSLGGTTAPVCPALASDGTFALIFVPAAQTVTVNTNALTGVTGNVRIRIYNVTAGTYSTVAASEAKTASRNVTTTSDCVVVIDQG